MISNNFKKNPHKPYAKKQVSSAWNSVNTKLNL